MADGIVTLTTATFEETVLSSDKPIIVDFWTEWCGPCKMIAPILSEIAAERNSTIIFPLPFELLRALEHLAVHGAADLEAVPQLGRRRIERYGAALRTTCG